MTASQVQESVRRAAREQVSDCHASMLRVGTGRFRCLEMCSEPELADRIDMSVMRE